MDKSIELVLVAVVALIVATIVIFLVQGQSGDFGDFLDSNSKGAKCDLYRAQCNQEAFNENQCTGDYPTNKCSENSQDSGEGQEETSSGCPSGYACVNPGMCTGNMEQAGSCDGGVCCK